MTDIAVIFARDPLDYTKTDVRAVVDRMRESRHQFDAGNLKAGSTKPKTAKQKETDAIAEKVSLNIADLL